MNKIKKIFFKFSQQNKNPIPTKAGCLILCRPNHSLTSFFNYQILLLKRKPDLSFGNTLTVVGGRYQQLDQKLAKIIGIKNNKLATSFREAFQEAGIYFTKNHIITTDQFSYLQKLKQIELINIIKKSFSMTEVYKNLVNSKYLPQDQNADFFLRIITRPYQNQRYQTNFFIKMIQDQKFINFHNLIEKGVNKIHETDPIRFQDTQFTNYLWMTPQQALRKYLENKQIELSAIYFIILNIMYSFTKFEELILYLKSLRYTDKNPEMNVLQNPNIMHVIKNQQSSTKSKYPFILPLIGDYQYPFQQFESIEQSKELVSQLKYYENSTIDIGLNRILIQDATLDFQRQYEVKCTVRKSILNKLKDYQRLKEALKELQIKNSLTFK